MRRCGSCGERKPIDEFAWRRKEKGQLDNYCRPCRARYKEQHYAANRQRYIDSAWARKQIVLAERLDFLIAYFAEHPCLDCGESDPIVLEFDHLRDKEFSISSGVRDRNWASVLDEIAKCDVVCANCHRRRTAKRGGFARAVVAQR
jgi:hypothetical protein